MRLWRSHNLFEVSLYDNPPSFFTTFRSQIDDIVRTSNHVKVVLDHDERMAIGEEFFEGFQEKLNISHMESCCRLIEDKEIPSRVDLADVLSKF